MEENILGTMPVKKLLLHTGIPIILSLFINSLYNFVDSIFVANIGEDALTALSLANPMQIIMSALGSGIAVGLNAVISRALGQKDADGVKKAATASISLAIYAWVVLAVLAVFIVRPYFDWQSDGNALIASYGRSYLFICMFFSLGQMCQWVFDRFVMATGKTKLFLISLCSASIVNLILDPVLIYGYFGFPALSTAGAAIATVIGQSVGMIVGFLVNRKWNPEISFGISIHPDFTYLKRILAVGIPTTIVQALVSCIGIYMNIILTSFSSTAVAVYGVCTKIQSLFLLVFTSGINNGLIPIVAYNYGAKKYDRIRQSVRWALIYEYSIYIVIFLIIQFFAPIILTLFNGSAEMINIGTEALRIVSIAWFVSITSLVCTACFQGFSKGTYAMVINLLRQIVILFIAITILSRFGLTYVWISFIVSELIVLPITIVLYQYIQKTYMRE